MRKYVCIGIGGAGGAILRHLITEADIGGVIANLPVNTLFINVLGCFLLAFIVTRKAENPAFSPDVRLGATAGFLGAFTTFSSVCGQTAGLMANGDFFSAVHYIAVSAVLGFSAAWLGFLLAGKTELFKTEKQGLLYPENEEE